MKVEIITIGDEILIGQIVDTNSAWMANQLNAFGFSVYQITSVTDSREHILNALNDALNRVDIVLITGGLGPTKDDITKNVLCEFFNTKLVFHEPSFNDIKKFIETRHSSLNKLNRQQAELPEICTPLQNLKGTAPGMWFEKEDKIIVSMPGVPYEMKYIMEHSVIPRLKQLFKIEAITHKTLLVFGLPEAILAEKLEEWEDAMPSFLKLAYLPSSGLIRLRFSAYNIAHEIAEAEINKQVEKIHQIIPEHIIGFDKQSMEEEINELFRKNKLSLSTAESCTGGKIAHLLTTVSGSSEMFTGSIVAYHNHVKIKTLGVEKENIKNFGAVSKPVAEQMASGVRNLFNTHFSIATTGIAGPTGGTAEKPVGTTWISIAGPERILAEKFQFAGDRNQIIDKAAKMAFNLLLKEVLLFLS